MLIHSASQLLTLSGGPQRGADLGRLGLIPDGAVLLREGRVAAVGSSAELRAAYPGEPPLDAAGRVVMPGLVDPHTHLVWAGDRAAEFELRLQGKTYMEIMAAGGGIVSTVRATRVASVDELVAQARSRAQSMLRHGATTAEAKTGYGLETQSELRQMEALLRLDEEGPLEIVPTFLGAHAVPAEFAGNPQGYTELVCAEMLPALRGWLVFVALALAAGGFLQLQILPDLEELAKSAGYDPHINRLVGSWLDPNFIGGYFAAASLFLVSLALYRPTDRVRILLSFSFSLFLMG